MIRHVKYNYRTDANGNVFCDWFNVGESFDYQEYDVEVVRIEMDWIRMQAEITVSDPKGNQYVITQQGIHQVFQDA